MVGIEAVSGSASAIATVGVVLGEALALYVAYGALGGLVGSDLLDAVGGE